MNIHILVDNLAGPHTDSEHGLSYFIEFDGKKILFDTGQSDLFLKNAELMNVYISSADFIVLSHGHFDHGNGLQYLNSGTLICHPGCFVKRFHKTDRRYIGLKNTKEELAGKFNLVCTETPFKISNRIIFLGSIPRKAEFESKFTSFVFEDGSPDFVMDDSALVLLLDTGLFIVSGCGHSGIINIIRYAVEVTGEQSILGIIGGFHLKDIDPQTKATISYMKEKNIKYVYPSHCTSSHVISVFHENFQGKEIKTGKVVRWKNGKLE